MTDATFVPRRSARVAKREAENPAPPKVVPAAKKAKTAASKPTAKSATKDSAGSSSDSKILEVGDALPNIVLKNQNDEDVNVFEVSKSNTVVIFGE